MGKETAGLEPATKILLDIMGDDLNEILKENETHNYNDNNEDIDNQRYVEPNVVERGLMDN